MKGRRNEAIIAFARDRRLAHQILFKHRHPSATPAIHGEMIDAFHSAEPRLVVEAFRGAAKSTIAEEGITLAACLGEFKNGIVVGASEARAMERLHAIKHEIESNDYLIELFGGLVGPVWAERKIELANGVLIQAFGRGQSLRGAKHLEQRPDFWLVDDLEDDEDIKTPEARAKTKRWFYRTFLPALAPEARGRYLGNRLDPEALIVELSKDPAWKHLRYPICYRDLKTGEMRATWPERFPMEWIEAKREEYARRGLLNDFNLEYMCEADAPEERSFRPEMIKVRPRVRTWQAVTCMFDPARSVNRQSATTGYAAWSWINNRLVIWDGWGRKLLPDELVKAVFEADEKFRPVTIGVEEDGLNEFLMQPLRQAQVKRAHVLPLEPVRAPKGKLDFIRGLQPFFASGEAEFASECPDLRQQLLAFPTGNIDAPNALAYALRLRPGLPIYEDFSEANIAEDMRPSPGRALWLALNATKSHVTGALVQFVDGGLRIFRDWIEEGDPGVAAPRLIAAARMDTGRAFSLIGPPLHFDQWSNVGLRQAVMRIPAEMSLGARPEAGRGEVRKLLRQTVRGNPAVLIAPEARWALNGFAGGYALAVSRGGVLATDAKPGPYRTLMEGIECFAGGLSLIQEDDDREGVRWATSRDGRPYITTMPGRH